MHDQPIPDTPAQEGLPQSATDHITTRLSVDRYSHLLSLRRGDDDQSEQGRR
jgi:hypothetical protein